MRDIRTKWQEEVKQNHGAPDGSGAVDAGRGASRDRRRANHAGAGLDPSHSSGVEHLCKDFHLSQGLEALQQAAQRTTEIWQQ